ncbi:MAG: hypothetical protein KH310_24270 [Enterobacteriaceae bacterium]|nr:hypothetical protein [Enterobacteriaceae bacterium]
MSIRLRIIVIFVCFILGVPAITSEYGYIWHMFKFGVQEINCVEDVSLGIKALDFDSGKNGSNDILKVQNELKNCVKNLDINKGSVEFLLEQHKRHQAH